MAYGKANLKIKKVKIGYIMYNETLGTHSHFRSYNGAMNCRKLIHKGIMPNNEYYIESCKRLLSDKEFATLKSKQRYHNVNNGSRQSSNQRGSRNFYR